MALLGKNLLDEPAPTYLDENPELRARLDAGDEAEDLAAAFPKEQLPWAMLAEEALADGRTLEGYAYARVGYHRGLDSLRGHGWSAMGGGMPKWGENQRASWGFRFGTLVFKI